MQKELNQEKVNLFLAVYKIELEKYVKANPDYYSWPLSELDTVHGRMTNAVLKGSFNKDSHAFKATCKAFGIKHTYKAIYEFLKGETK